MPRIAGVDIPKNKKIYISLTYIYGIGKTTALEILQKAEVDPEKRAGELSAEEVQRIRRVIDEGYKVEGGLRAEVQRDIKRLMDIKAYRGLRHMRGLPVRGQRTHSNARTRKGPRNKLSTKKKKKEK